MQKCSQITLFFGSTARLLRRYRGVVVCGLKKRWIGGDKVKAVRSENSRHGSNVAVNDVDPAAQSVHLDIGCCQSAGGCIDLYSPDLQSEYRSARSMGSMPFPVPRSTARLQVPNVMNFTSSKASRPNINPSVRIRIFLSVPGIVTVFS